jgi:hypothetical protein
MEVGLITGVLLFGSGCMTALTLQRARGDFSPQPKCPAEQEKNKGPEFHQLNYLLLPVTVPIDIATFPLVLPWLFLTFPVGGC